MPRPPSLTLRLTLLFSIATALVFSAFGWFVERSIKHHFRDGDIAKLSIIKGHVSQLFSISEAENYPDKLKKKLDDLLVGHHGAFLFITKENSRENVREIFFASVNDPDLIDMVYRNSSQLESSLLNRWDAAEHSYRVVSLNVVNQKLGQKNGQQSGEEEIYRIFVAMLIDHHLVFIEKFRFTLWMMIISGFVLMGFLGWFAVRKGNAPLYKIVTQIRGISASELDMRLQPEEVPRELAELAVSLNEHLERMEKSFQQLSAFSADLAHELRTPISNLMTQTQVALTQSRDLDEYQSILYSNMEEYERLSQMISDMLFLAKSDNGLLPPSNECVNLKSELVKLCDYYGIWAEEKGIALTLEGQAEITGDALMLRRAMSNLIENGIRYTVKGGYVKIIISKINNNVQIVVENPGTPIAKEHLSRLFDRFYRIDPSRQHSDEGVGLGLAIVKSIIVAHSGGIVVESDAEGTRFITHLPISY